MSGRLRRIGIVCQPWDVVGPDSGSSIPIIAYQLGRRLARHSHVTICGRRGVSQRSTDADGQSLEFRRFTIFRKPWAVAETLSGIFACWRNIRMNLLFRSFYHLSYSLRAALCARASAWDTIIVFNFPQTASMIKRLNPRATVILYMQCMWLVQFATGATLRQLHRIDLVIGCSDYVTDAIKRRFPSLGRRCRTVHNGVDPDLFHPARDAKRDGIERLLFVGRLSPEKGVHVLIEAFHMVAARRPALELHLVGAADLLGYLYLGPSPGRDDRPAAGLLAFYGDGLVDMVRRQLVERHSGYLEHLRALIGGDDRIVLHPPVSQADTVPFYQSAAAMVFPSVWAEPFGMPALEAIACGVPVVATTSGGIPEIVECERTGFLAAPGDAGQLALAIDQALDSSERLAASREAGRRRAIDRFAWDTIAAGLSALIDAAALGSIG